MKFMMLMGGNLKGFEQMGSWSKDDFRAHVAFMMDFNRKLKANGEFVLAEGLDMPSKAKIVRSGPAGEAIVSDGPFAETKEFLAGFWIIDVASEARAIEVAAAASAAPGKGGAPISIPIELRAVPSGPPEV